jgi:hypothetical protein
MPAAPPLSVSRFISLGRLRWVAIPVGAVSLAALYIFVLYPLRFAFGDPKLPDDVVSALKAAVALLALGLSIYAAFRRATKNPISRRTELGVSAGLAVLGVIGYLNFGDVGYKGGYHRWEMFHYYLGAKYQSAVRYDAIYAATAVAQAELSPAMAKEVGARSIRNLGADEIVPAQTAVADAAAIKSRFASLEQWEAFKADVAFFRNSCDKKWWNDMQMDHGFNASPVWMLGGQAAVSIAPASDGFMRLLGGIDLALFALLFTAIAWAFGPRVTCLALVFWGTQWPFDLTFTFGALLRQDWVLCLVLAACLAKKRRYALAGAALAYSALLRVFPAIFFIPMAIGAVVHFARMRDRPLFERVERRFKRFFAGAAVTTVLVGGLSVVVYGPDTYREFAHRIATHKDAPATNLMGMKSIVAFDWGQRVDMTKTHGTGDDFATWRALRQERAKDRAPFVLAGVTLTLILAGWVARRRYPLWVYIPLGLPLFMGLTEISNYYYATFLLLPLFARFGKRFELLTLGTGGLSAVFVVWGRVSSTFDSRCYFQSWVFLLASLAVLYTFGNARRAAAPATATAPVPTPTPALPRREPALARALDEAVAGARSSTHIPIAL